MRVLFYVQEDTVISIGVIWGRGGMCADAPPLFFYLRITFFWLQIWSGANKNRLTRRKGVYEPEGLVQTNIPLFLTRLLRKLNFLIPLGRRSQQPRGLRRNLRPFACWGCGFESRRVHGYRSLESVVCCQVEVSTTGRSFVQRSPTDRGVSECDSEASIMRRSWSTRGCRTIKKYQWSILCLDYLSVL